MDADIQCLKDWWHFYVKLILVLGPLNLVLILIYGWVNSRTATRSPMAIRKLDLVESDSMDIYFACGCQQALAGGEPLLMLPCLEHRTEDKRRFEQGLAPMLVTWSEKGEK